MAEQKVCLVQGLGTYLSKKWVQESKMHPTFALKVFEIKTHINKKVLHEMKNISSKGLEGQCNNASIFECCKKITIACSKLYFT